MHGPLFRDGSFDYIPIPDGLGVDERAYGNTPSRKGRKLIDYFPESRRASMSDCSVHFDPEFESLTYGDPTPPKAGLRHLQKGDMLIFYCGLQGWDFKSDPALYLMGYFEVIAAGKPDDFGNSGRSSCYSGITSMCDTNRSSSGNEKSLCWSRVQTGVVCSRMHCASA